MNMDDPPSDLEFESQVVDFHNTHEGLPLTRNQSNPWSPILNAHVREKFLPYFGDPRRLRLIYNATEHGWSKKDFIPRAKLKRGLLFVIKAADTGRVFG